MINNFTYCKFIILNNEYFWNIYNIEIIILILPKITLIIILNTSECVVEVSLKGKWNEDMVAYWMY
jgi:hypothetical protein